MNARSAKDKNIKLPLIHTKVNQLPPLPKQRPQSHRKQDIQDLEKTLFSKIQAIDSTSSTSVRRKKFSAESCKEIKNATEERCLQKLSKLAPQIYNRLAKVQKAERSIKLEIPVKTEEPSRENKLKKQANSTQFSIKEQEGYFVTDVKESPLRDEVEDVCDKEMERIYTEYLKHEGLGRETTSKELRSMNDEFQKNDRELRGLTKSFEEMLTRLHSQVSFVE